jgi:hypothetical protein
MRNACKKYCTIDEKSYDVELLISSSITNTRCIFKWKSLSEKDCDIFVIFISRFQAASDNLSIEQAYVERTVLPVVEAISIIV